MQNEARRARRVISSHLPGTSHDGVGPVALDQPSIAMRRVKLLSTGFAIASLLLLHVETARADDLAGTETDAKAREIVEAADRVRFPGEGFQVDVAIVTTTKDADPEERKYRILSKGNENTLVMITEPAAERGQILLMKARDLWVFLPNVSQPVRLSLSQRLTGQVANGDLARANFAGDYNPKLSRTEVIDGVKYHVLELTAIDRSVTYQRVMYWVNESTFAPLKAEFYSLSNRLLKTCTYGKYERMLGKLRPTRLIMTDALRQDEQSVLDYSEMKLRDLPDKIFTKDYLKRLQ